MAQTADSEVGASGHRACRVKGCGACSQIEVVYATQLERKQQRIADLFAELIEPTCAVEPVLGMDDPWAFRNKIASPFAPGRKGKGANGRGSGTARGPSVGRGKAAGGKLAGKAAGGAPDILCGMFAPGTHRIVEVEECPVEHPVGRRVVQAVRRIMRKHGMQPYDEDAHTGFVRYVVVRVGHASDEVLVTVVTSSREFVGARNFARELVKQVPQVTTVVQNVNPRVTNAILGDEEHVLFGPGFILDELCGLSFRISSHSFYQVNAVQTERLYRCAIDLACQGAPAAGGAGLAVVDAYCGTGTIGLAAASLMQQACAGAVHVVGVDTTASSIRDARQNAQHNGIENAEFVQADAGEYLQQRAAQGDPVDVLFLDPPRSGASQQFLQAALACKPAAIVYISCNPETQVRDARILIEGGYHLDCIAPVDMFPHTDHVECVALMSRIDAASA